MTTFPIINYQQRAVLSSAIIFSVIPAAAVLLRVLARRISSRSLNLTDYCAIIAAALTIALEAISITAVFHGGLAYGHASEIVTQFGSEPVAILLKLTIPLQFLWTLSLAFSKTSILLLYSQLFKAEYHILITARAAMAITVAWAAGTILAGCLICQPFSMNWKTIPNGHCGDQVLSFIITGTINLATDVAIVILPLPALYKLRMGIYKKLALVAIFSLGFLTCITSAIRLVCLTQMDFTDIPYSMTLANIFSGLEPSMAVTLACIPLFRPLIGRCKYRNGIDRGFRTSGREQFQPLGDESGGDQLRLRPLGLKHPAEVSAVSVDKGASHESRDGSSFEAKDDSRQTPGIMVSREWEVTR
ncbi:integral membrane protein [Diaporthe amygdali]|uniref:uncharacterized protein n=1 Tax=Phomopsis amygdali TaxID=1214568 RepID=UPI0022FE351B|nr:uncharacterized protein J7T55_001914 [Diaporthe amygdali]KAJ0117714.1 integral membrane protein [Diaporthe amygdali]